MRDWQVISALARSLLAGSATVDEAHARAIATLFDSASAGGHPWRWLRPLAQRFIERFAGRTRPRHRDVVAFLVDDEGFGRAREKYRGKIAIARWIAGPQRMQPVAAAARWNLPPIESLGDLADSLCLSDGELEWFADLKALGNKAHNLKLQHYHYRMLPKASGGVRVTEIPKPWLKLIQRRILASILDRVPAHGAVHGFVKGRSIATFAAPHAAKHIVLRLDLRDFFPTFPAARVAALFRTLGYPESVAARLAGICTNAIPDQAWLDRPVEFDATSWPSLCMDSRGMYARPHLPQGAPTSPALANLMSYRLDCRLAGLAKSAGAGYTRYADDLAFSGAREFARVVDRFAAHAAAIALEEGFSVNHRKTRVMRQGVRQQLAGVVVNRALNPRRCEVERLEATLYNCARYGPESQNRAGVADFRAHLEGRIGFIEMIHREKGRRLRALFRKIAFGLEELYGNAAAPWSAWAVERNHRWA